MSSTFVAGKLDSRAARNEEPVVIIGAGFAGLACAKALGAAGVRVRLIDRHNYHLFVPLLYQVATAALSPADIAQPIRRILRRYPSVEVQLGEVERIDTATRQVILQDGDRVSYGPLVIAAGSLCNYFGHEEWASAAPCPRDLGEATAIRGKILMALERAEHCHDEAQRKALTTFVVVGGGPTGVEMAGAIAELVRHALKREFRRIDPAQAAVLLIEGGPRLLGAFPDELAEYARGRLDKLGVKVMTGMPVELISEAGVTIGGRLVASATVVWGAGTRPAPAANWLGSDTPGRLPVQSNLAVEGHEGVFAMGDVALCKDESGRPLPALAQVAKQQGHHLGRGLAQQIRSGQPLLPFRFRNRGNTAIIGRNAAIFDFGHGRTLRGRTAWLLWALVHIYLLNGLERRFLVATQWLVRYATRQRGARLITSDEAQADRKSPAMLTEIKRYAPNGPPKP